MNLLYNKLVYPSLLRELTRLAAIYIKNRVSKAWSKDNAETYQTAQISDVEKVTFRPQIIQILVVASPTIRAQFTAILNKILASDYPAKWPEFCDLTLGLLQSGQVAEVFAGLTMLLEMTKVYRWKAKESRAGLDHVINTAFPVALQIANRLLADPSVAAATMLVLILKAYKCAIAVYPDSSHSDTRWNYHHSCKRILC